MTTWYWAELVFGILCVLLAAREILRIATLSKVRIQSSKQRRERCMKILGVAWLLLIATGPIGYHGLIIINQLSERPFHDEPANGSGVPTAPFAIGI